MSAQDDIREHADYVMQYLDAAVALRDEIYRIERKAQSADFMARIHFAHIKALKLPEPALSTDQVRASLADSYVENTA